PDLSVVIPAFNERQRLPPTLAAVERYLRESNRSSELIVVDDGSTDGTGKAVEEMIGQGFEFRLLRHDRNRGKGAAVRTGMLAATGNLVLFTDADLSTPIADVEPLIAALAAGADVAIGSRAMDRSLVEVHQPWIRDRMGRVFNLMVQLILLPRLKDTQCGFKLFRRAAARDLFEATTSDGFEFDTEVLYRARRSGLAIREIPVHWRNSPDTRVNALVDSPRMLLALFRIRRSVK
ncbi:MAG: glycosyltransferase family 2 protein, partial [Candidatus Dormibacteraeota bacterium]|nr:glycosyltransferase family 2 protein [Candidatus Dormibacteraeota bacterium]